MIYYIGMIYLFHGTDQKKTGEQVQSIVQALKAKRELAQVFYIYPDSFSKEAVEGVQSSNGLFFDKHVFVYKDMLQANKDVREYFFEKLAEYVDSPHVHIFMEGEMDEKNLKLIDKHKDIKIKKYDGGLVSSRGADVSKKMFSVVSNVAGLKSLNKEKRSTTQKIRVWKAVDEIRVGGTAPEEFFGILWWRYRSMAQARGVTQKASGLTPYSYTEAKRLVDAYDSLGGSLFQRDMKILLDIYHDAHNGECSMWEGLEAWVLG